MWHHRQQQSEGKSFAELSAALNPNPRRIPSLSEVRSMPAAGKKSDAPIIGAVKFVMESGWSIGVPPPVTPSSTFSVPSTAPSSNFSTRPSTAACILATSTTTRASYQPPPLGLHRRGAIRNTTDSFPKGTHPNEYRTLQQTDYLPGVLQQTERVRPSTVRDSGRLLPLDVATCYDTQHAMDYGRLTPTIVKDSRGRISSGGFATQRANYNIITGGSSLVNNNFEHWDTRDYRRHR